MNGSGRDGVVLGLILWLICELASQFFFVCLMIDLVDGLSKTDKTA